MLICYWSVCLITCMFPLSVSISIHQQLSDNNNNNSNNNNNNNNDDGDDDHPSCDADFFLLISDQVPHTLTHIEPSEQLKFSLSLNFQSKTFLFCVFVLTRDNRSNMSVNILYVKIQILFVFLQTAVHRYKNIKRIWLNTSQSIKTAYRSEALLPFIYFCTLLITQSWTQGWKSCRWSELWGRQSQRSLQGRDRPRTSAAAERPPSDILTGNTASDTVIITVINTDDQYCDQYWWSILWWTDVICICLKGSQKFFYFVRQAK